MAEDNKKANLFDLGRQAKQEINKRFTTVNTPSAIGSSIDFTKLGEDYIDPSSLSLSRGNAALLDQIQTAKDKFEFDDAKAKADAQGFFGEAGNAIAQLPGKLVGKTLEYAGYLLDFESHLDFMFGNGDSVGNWLSDVGSSIDQASSDYFKVYQSPEGAGTSWQRGHEWFWGNAPDLVADPLTLLGVARLPGLALKSANIGSKMAQVGIRLNKPAKAFLEGVGTAITSRQIESSAEANEVYKAEIAKLEQARQNGEISLNDDEIRQKAGEAAAFTYRWNWWMLGQDLFQYSKLFKGMPLNRAIDDFKVGQAVGLTKGQVLRGNIARNVVQGLGEGGEEAFQFVVGEEGKHFADVKAGLKEDSSFSSRLKEYLSDGDFWDSAILGAMGGSIFSSVSPAVQRMLSKSYRADELADRNARINEIKTRQDRITLAAKAMNEASQANNEDAYNTAKKTMEFGLGVNAASVGNLDLVLDNLDQFKNATDEQKQQLGLDDNLLLDIDNIKNNVEKAAKYYQKATAYDSATAESISYRQFMIDHYNDQLSKTSATINSSKINFPRYSQLSIEGKRALDLIVEKATNEKFIKQLETRKTNESEEDVKYTDSIIKMSKLGSTAVEEGITELFTSGSLTPQDEEILQSAESPIIDEWASNLLKTELYRDAITKYSLDLKQLRNPSNKKIVDRVEKQVAKTEDTIKEDNKATEEEINRQSKVANQQILDKQTQSGTINPKLTITQEEQLKSLGYNNEDIELMDEQTAPALISNKTSKQIDITDKVSLNELLENINTAKQSDKVDKSEFDEEGNVAIDNDNIDVDIEYDESSKKNKVSSASWKSYRNPDSRGADRTDENLIRTEFLESPLIDVTQYNVEYRIDSDRIDNLKEYKSIKDKLAKGEPLGDELGILPVRAYFVNKDGSEVIYKGIPMYTWIHNDTYNNFHSSIQQAAIEHLLDIKSSLVAGENVKAKILGRSSGHIISTDKEAQNNLSDILQTDSDTIKLAISSGYQYQDKEGDIKELSEYSTKTKGALYAIVTNLEGKVMPLRVFTNKLNNAEASLVASLYWNVLKGISPKGKLSAEFQERIKNSKDLRVSQLANFYDLKDITVMQAIKFFTFNGKTNLANSVSIDLKEGTLNVADKVFTIESTPEQIRDALLSITRQVNLDKLNDPKYNKYLIDNNIIYSNTDIPTEEFSSIFVQPTIEFDTNLVITADDQPDAGWTEEEIQQHLKEVDPTNDKEDLKNKLTSGKVDEDLPPLFKLTTPIITPSQIINLEEELDWLKSRLPNIPINVIEDYIKVTNNTTAFGMFNDNMITVSKGAIQGTIYHEAFHAVQEMMLSSQEYKAIMKEAADKYNTTNMAELKESLANDFEAYKVTQSEKGAISKFFSKLYNILKELFSSQLTIDVLYNRIDRGYYKNIKPSASILDAIKSYSDIAIKNCKS